jgi:acyl carrier protein
VTDVLSAEVNAAESSAEIERFVYEILTSRFDVPAMDLSPSTNLLELGIDSLGGVEIGLELKAKYGVSFLSGDLPVELTVRAIADLVYTKLTELKARTS